MKIVFMGTPDFAVPCLRKLAESGHEVAAVFTQPDKPKGRGYALAPPPVKEKALEYGLTVYQPTTLRDGEALSLLTEMAPDMIVVVAYGKILPKEIIDLPRFGCVNIHASLLPLYRGAAPIQQSVLDGCEKTGVTAQCMDVGIDTGDVLGDVNGDGAVGIDDVTFLIDMLLTGSSGNNADVNGDGQVGIEDVTALIDMLLCGA